MLKVSEAPLAAASVRRSPPPERKTRAAARSRSFKWNRSHARRAARHDAGAAPRHPRLTRGDGGLRWRAPDPRGDARQRPSRRAGCRRRGRDLSRRWSLRALGRWTMSPRTATAPSSRNRKAVDGSACPGAALPLPRAVLHVHCASRRASGARAFHGAALAARWPVMLHLHGTAFATFYEEECGPVRRAIGASSSTGRGPRRRFGSLGRLDEGVTANPRVVTIPNSVRMPLPARAKREPALVVFAGAAPNPRPLRRHAGDAAAAPRSRSCAWSAPATATWTR